MNMNDEKRKSANWGRVVRQLLVVTLIGWAVATELRKPAGERTWHGKLAERVPYDLRRPSVARVRERMWNPADRHILAPTVFGVGWTINFGRLLMPWKAKPHLPDE